MNKTEWRYRHNLLSMDGTEVSDVSPGDLIRDPVNKDRIGLVVETQGAFQARIMWSSDREPYGEPGYIYAPYVPLQVSNICVEVKKS